MGIKKLFSLAVLLSGVYFLGRNSSPDLGQVLNYVDNHPKHQELVINKAMYSREKQNLNYSPETLGNFSRALLKQFSRERLKTNISDKLSNYNSEEKESDLSKLKKTLYNLVLDMSD